MGGDVEVGEDGNDYKAKVLKKKWCKALGICEP